ncbi:High-affinity branched-chain amino acid transport ATP-binding protein LivF [subsurface metagenome]
MILDVKSLVCHYGKIEALKGVSLSIKEGAIVAIIGANGAGKTTVLRTISGLKASTSGEIWFREQRIEDIPTPKRVKLGIAHALEGRRLFNYMTVLENIRMGAYLRKDKSQIQADINDMFERFPWLKERSGQLAGSLSGGEQQMLSVARALMSKPAMLLMDEPTLGLSPLMVNQVVQTIREINQSGVTIVLVEQNARMALKLAHHAYVMETGNIVLSGETKELLNNEKVRQAYLAG